MNKKASLTLVGCLVLGLLLSLPAYAQEQEAIPVSGSFNYIPSVLASGVSNGHTLIDATEDEVWTGDFEGTAVSRFPYAIWSTGFQYAPLITEFEGTVLGQYEGTLEIVTVYTRPDAAAHWTGQWMIVGGTGELEHLRGYGGAWGPGFSGEADDGITDIYFSGTVMFLEPVPE
jgi:hypothetical protein